MLFRDAVTQMGISEDRIRPCQVPLIDFTERAINSNEVIELLVKVHRTTWNVEFLVVDAPSSYNGLLGRPALNQMKATVSVYSLTLEVQTLGCSFPYGEIGWQAGNVLWPLELKWSKQQLRKT